MRSWIPFTDTLWEVRLAARRDRIETALPTLRYEQVGMPEYLRAPMRVLAAGIESGDESAVLRALVDPGYTLGEIWNDIVRRVAARADRKARNDREAARRRMDLYLVR
jgi:hypothetical protein